MTRQDEIMDRIVFGDVDGYYEDSAKERLQDAIADGNEDAMEYRA